MALSHFSTRAITFNRAVTLKGVNGLVPPGTHSLETESIRIEGLSHPVYCRLASRLTYTSRPGLVLTCTVDPEDLEAAAARDKATR